MITGKIDASKNPIELTVTSDKRIVTATVQAVGETAELKGQFPVTITATGGRTWTLKSDDGTTAVYTG